MEKLEAAKIAHELRRPLDDVDRKILSALQTDGRMSNIELAERVGLSPSPCLRRVQRLEAEGYITGYRAELDRLKLGLQLTVFLEIKTDRYTVEIREEMSRMLVSFPEVVSCFMVSGEADYLVEVAVPDMAAYEHFLSEKVERLPSVKEMRSNFALRTMRVCGPLPIPER